MFLSSILLILFLYYKKNLVDFMNDKVYIFMASNIIIQGMDVEDVANVINYNVFVYVRMILLLITNIEQYCVGIKEWK